MGNKTFANDPAEWILGRTATEELSDASGTRVRMTRSYYDGAPFVGLPLGKVTRGDLTRQEAWVGPGLEEFDDVAMSKYDAHGNVLETRDARGGGRQFEWDAAGIADPDVPISRIRLLRPWIRYAKRHDASGLGSGLRSSSRSIAGQVSCALSERRDRQRFHRRLTAA